MSGMRYPTASQCEAMFDEGTGMIRRRRLVRDEEGAQSPGGKTKGGGGAMDGWMDDEGKGRGVCRVALMMVCVRDVLSPAKQQQQPQHPGGTRGTI